MLCESNFLLSVFYCNISVTITTYSAGDGKLGFGTYRPGLPDTSSYGYASVDQFLAWHRVLTPAEITIVYNAQA